MVADQTAPVADAAPADAVDVASDGIDALAGAIDHTAAAPAEGDAASTVVVFIDAAVQDAGIISAAIPPGATIIVLDANSDGVEQISAALQSMHEVDAIHIIAHGAEGELRLGNAVLDATSMQGEHLDELTAIGGSLSADGDILIYGCDFTAGDRGLEAAIILGGVTGADIAASRDATGHEDLGGDWTLETEVGHIEAQSIVAADWHGLLTPNSARLDWANEANLTLGTPRNYSFNGAADALTVTVSGSGNIYNDYSTNYTGGSGDATLLMQPNSTSTSTGQTFDLTFNASGFPVGVNTVTFDVTNIDSGTWDDRITIQVYDINGVLLPGTDITVTPLQVSGQTYSVTTQANSVRLDGNIDGAAGDNSPQDTARISITSSTGADIGRVVVLYTSGTSGTTTGLVGISDIAFTFDLPPTLDLDSTDSNPPVVVASDNFSSNSGSGGTGWAGNWVETDNAGDDVRFVSGYLEIRDPDQLGAATRTVDLSAYVNPTVSFTYTPGGLDNTGTADTFVIEYSTDGGATWNIIVDSDSDGDNNNSGTVTNFSLGAEGTANTQFRVRFDGGSGTNTEYIRIDDLVIRGEVPRTGYSTSVMERTGPVSIASSNVEITDVLDTHIVSATITLTNPQSGDVLSVIGSLPSGIVASAYNSGTGTITLTGSATLADYQAAIEALGFSATGSPGTDRIINVTVNDGNFDSNTAVSTITVVPNPNNPPVDADESNTAAEDQILLVNAANGVLANATDPDGDTLTVLDFTITGVSGPHAAGSTVVIPGVGTIQMFATGAYTFGPAANYSGPVPAIVYTVSDGNGDTNTSTLSLTVTPVNDPPVANDDTFTVAEDSGATALNVLGNDSILPDTGETLTVTSVTQPAHGTVVINPDGTVSYTPDANYNGADSFTYTISDGNGGTATATVNLTVTPVNEPPVANDDTFTVEEDSGSTALNVLGYVSFLPD
ncbi:MAG: DUF4347 domain-containing protein, partial [Hyphomicrobiaceae bacterium]